MLTLQDLSFGYNKNTMVIDHLDLTILPNQR